jgi:hypothetical protein
MIATRGRAGDQQKKPMLHSYIVFNRELKDCLVSAAAAGK